MYLMCSGGNSLSILCVIVCCEGINRIHCGEITPEGQSRTPQRQTGDPHSCTGHRRESGRTWRSHKPKASQYLHVVDNARNSGLAAPEAPEARPEERGGTIHDYDRSTYPEDDEEGEVVVLTSRERGMPGFLYVITRVHVYRGFARALLLSYLVR